MACNAIKPRTTTCKVKLIHVAVLFFGRFWNVQFVQRTNEHIYFADTYKFSDHFECHRRRGQHNSLFSHDNVPEQP